MSGKYTIVSKIGNGTYGKIYKAQTTTGTTVALKRNMIYGSTSGSTMFNIRELDILHTVRGHPYCIQLKDTIYRNDIPSMSPLEPKLVDDKLVFVLELGQNDGHNWIHTKDQNRPYNIVERKMFMLHLLLGLEFLHSRGIYHRDLKPANIIVFLDSSGKYVSSKITDYGLAQYYTSQTMTNHKMVTSWYRAPEVALCKQYTYKIDVWSCACIFYEAVTLNRGRPILFRINADENYQLINKMIEDLVFPPEDYVLAKTLYGPSICSKNRYLELQGCLDVPKERLQNILSYEESNVSLFNSKKIAGLTNFGSYAQFMDLLMWMLNVNPDDRPTVTDCINHDFFRDKRQLIDTVRLQHEINSSGVWTFKPEQKINYVDTPDRATGMKWFGVVYKYRDTLPWYTHQVLIHAMDLFDRYLTVFHVKDNAAQDTVSVNQDGANDTKTTRAKEYDILVYVNTFLYISAKYFRNMVPYISSDDFTVGIPEDKHSQFRKKLVQFETMYLKDVDYHVYHETVYEYILENLSSESIKEYLDIYTKEPINGMTFYQFVDTYGSRLGVTV